jgi:hypothetical protein
MSDYLSDLTRGLKEKRIEAPDSFTEDVMDRIAIRELGGFKSMSVPARILLSSIVVALYCSLGILLGAKGYKDTRQEREASSQKALVELMESHYIDTDSMHDQLFRNLNHKD